MRLRAATAAGFMVMAGSLLAGGCGGGGSDTPNGRTATPAGASATATATHAKATPSGAGELIAFSRFVVPDAFEPDLYAVGPDGGEPKLLTSSGEYPHWSPDGSVLAFESCPNPPHCTTAVELFDRSTGDVHGLKMPNPKLSTTCTIWAPSGRKLACQGNSRADPRRNGVYTIRASDGKGLTRMTRHPGGLDIPLAYSPDGSQLLLARTKSARSRALESADQALFVAPISGGQPHQITPWGYTDDYASWSPDGRTIVFGTKGALYHVNPQGHGLAKIALKLPDGSSAQTAFDVSFSPGGDRIVFSMGNSHPGLYTARSDGADVMKLTDSPGGDHHANWSAAPAS